jgi:hypothetical protein
VIDAILEDDKQRPVEQRHIAKRIFERLKKENQLTGGYTIVKDPAHLPRSAEVERLTVERVGPSIFRQALIEYWNCSCPLTGITDPALLRASHIVPWAECESDALPSPRVTTERA